MNDCIFCKIASKQIPTNIVWESDDVIAFDDIHPKAPVHVLIVPKKHTESYDVFLGKAAQAVAKAKGVDQSGYRLIVNQGRDAGQEVNHFHMHLLGGESLGPMVTQTLNSSKA